MTNIYLEKGQCSNELGYCLNKLIVKYEKYSN